ncbi:MAG TPA: ribosomal L7Ae/L30e/S12e/Gadd45 family protein [Longimicrobiaceae bacterium]|nr:ribosomal L7Ae/L30e/S12e/Gadd45 family protein [Longimicrobiaceae bacterium]
MTSATEAARAERAVLDLLGLAARAGAIVWGTDAVRDGVRNGKVARVVLAADAAPAQRAKLMPLLEAKRLRHDTVLDRQRLGAAIGRTGVSAIGLTDRNLARRAGELLATLTSLQDSAREEGR